MTVMLLQNNATPPTTIYNNNNNNNKTGSCDGGPSTIEEQYKNLQVNIDLRLSKPRLNLFSQPGGVKHKGRAMNYYRIWIYTCNAVLLLSVVGFIVVAASLVIVDPRRSLIPGLSLYHPSLLYSYLALLAQCGLLQIVGCLGALKLNEKLLNTYWLLLLFLLFGDAIIGIVWIFKFDKIYTELRPILKHRLQHEYGVDVEFTNVWNGIQHEFQCCGVEGPQDFNTVDLALIDENEKNRVDSLRTDNKEQTETTSTDYTWQTTEDDNETDGTTYTNWILTNYVTMSSVNVLTTSSTTTTDNDVKYVSNVPETCCRVLKDNRKEIEDTEELERKPMVIQKRKNRTKREEERIQKKKRYVSFRNSHTRHESSYRNTHQFPQSSSIPSNDSLIKQKIEKPKKPKYTTGNIKIMNTCAKVNGFSVGTIYGMTETLHFSVGCELRLKKWLTDSAHLLGVFGYCVVAFLKLCFLGILKYEIKEMIQKIKLLQNELQPPILLLSADSPHDSGSPTSPRLCNHLEGRKTECDGNALLLLQPPESNQTTPVHHIKTIQMTQNHKLISNILHNDTGNESDTNSHSALLLDREESYRKHTRVSSNGNNNFETHEMQELLLSHSTQI